MTIISNDIKLEYHMDKVKDYLNFEEFDKKYEVDTGTGGFLDLWNISNSESVYPDWEENNNLYPGSSGYQTTAIKHLDEINEILYNLIPNIQEYSFVDVGSGKGKVIINNIIKESKYNKNIGIEIDKNLYDISIKNLNVIKNKFNINNVEIYNKDILDYKCIKEPSIYFFFNPFSNYIYKKFLIKNKKQFLEYPTLIVQIYPFYPTLGENTDFIEFPIEENMQFKKIFNEKYILIYSSL